MSQIPMPMWVCPRCGFTLPIRGNTVDTTPYICRKCNDVCYHVEYAPGEIILLNEQRVTPGVQ